MYRKYLIFIAILNELLNYYIILRAKVNKTEAYYNHNIILSTNMSILRISEAEY